MTSRMTATDELRRLLDERGVEWRDDSSIYGTRRTVWTADGVTYVAAEVSGRLKVSGYLTSEQAIEATLGLGTCSLVREYFGQSGNWYRLVCSECHHIIYDGWQEKPRYCPFCGRRVVDA